MKNDKLVPGLILVLIGAAILLANFGYLHFHWYNIFRLWPIFLVIGGVNLVFANNKSPWATILKISVVILGFGLILFGNFGDRYTFWPGTHWSYNNDDKDDNNNSKDDDDDDDDDNNNNAAHGTLQGAVNGVFNEAYTTSVKNARLNIGGGATAYKISASGGQLFSATTATSLANQYQFSHYMDDSTYVIDFKMKDHHDLDFDSDKNKADISLNVNPIWDIHVETGASSVDFDLSPYKVSALSLHGGAASFHVKMGMPLDLTNIDVQTGVSSVEISIPQNAACKIETESGLSDNHFEGFNKTGDNDYETTGYDNAKNKMHIHIAGGLSGFSVNRY
jgi:hypothetical protein